MPPAMKSMNRATALIDLGVGVFLCVVAVRAVTTTSFENIMIGCIEFLVGICIGVVALIRFPLLDHEMHFLYTYTGKAIVYILFGTLGLSGDVIRYVFAAATIGIGLLYAICGCFLRQTPIPCIDCGEWSPPSSKPAAPFAAEAKALPAATPATARAANPWNAPVDGDRIGPKAAPSAPKTAAPANPFRAAEAEP